MSLRRKTIFIIAVAFLGFLSVILLASQFILVRSYEALEQEEVRQDSQLVLNAFLAAQDGLAVSASSWSVWDDAYQYAVDGNPKFEEDISGEALATQNYDLGLVTNTTGQVTYRFALNETRDELAAPPAEVETITQQALALALIDQPYSPEGELQLLAGLVRLNDQIYLVGIAPIMPTIPITEESNGQLAIAPSRGLILFGRRVDGDFQTSFAQSTRQDLHFLPYQADALQSELVDDIALTPLDSSTLLSQMVARDLQGRPLFIIEASFDRPILAQGIRSTRFYLAMILGLGALLSGVLLLLLDRMVLGRLKLLSSQVDAVRVSADPTLRVEQSGQDELGSLGGNINAMLARLATVQHDLEAARQKAETSVRLKDQFLANISHELRTPLNAIMGYTSLLIESRQLFPQEKQSDMLNRVYVNSTHLLSVINDLLDFSKLAAGEMPLQPETFHLKAFADEVLEQTQGLALAKGLHYVVWVDPTLPSDMYADPLRLKQILLNLISNAIKFTDQGKVKVELKAGANGHWSMEVSDTGIGIPPEAHAVIFQEFQQVDGSSTRQHSGTGLGLAIVHHLTLMMGGSIALQSEVGKGSTFSVQLPIVTQ
jgi:signal transduction histidine kinase